MEPFTFCESYLLQPSLASAFVCLFISATFAHLTLHLLLLSPVSISCFFFVPPFLTFYLFFLVLCWRRPSSCLSDSSAPLLPLFLLRFVFANHYYLHPRIFIDSLSVLAKEKDIWLAFAFFCVVCQIWNLNFYVSYFLCLLPTVASSSSFLSRAVFFCLFFYRTLTIFCADGKGVASGGEVQGQPEVARDSPEIVNFCLLLLDFYLLGGDGNGNGNGYVRLLFKKVQLLPLSESHVTPRRLPPPLHSPNPYEISLSYCVLTRWKP